MLQRPPVTLAPRGIAHAHKVAVKFTFRPILQQRFLEHVSPSKTYAGLLGGLIATTVVSLVGLWAAGQPVLYGLVLGPVVGLAAQCGDLAESMLKRAAGAKNSSDLIPGHGGVLDRVDSFLLAAPVMTLFVLTFLR